jgi:uncharacterized phiE125 gp8 family phage protein
VDLESGQAAVLNRGRQTKGDDMALRRTTDAAVEPMTTAEAKAWLRETSSAQDTIVDSLVKAARMAAEHELCRSLITQTWTKTLDAFPDAIELHYPPIIAVASVKYYDTAGAWQTLDSGQYTLDSQSEPGWLVPAYNCTWPDTLDAINAVEVIYTAGYGASAAYVPQAIKTWLGMAVATMEQNRQLEIAEPGIVVGSLGFANSLLDQYRIIRSA